MPGDPTACNANCDSSGSRNGSQRTAQNDRARCNHSGCSGFFVVCASYQNRPSGGDRNRTNAVSLRKAGCRVRLRRIMRRNFGGSRGGARPGGRPGGRNEYPGGRAGGGAGAGGRRFRTPRPYSSRRGRACLKGRRTSCRLDWDFPGRPDLHESIGRHPEELECQQQALDEFFRGESSGDAAYDAM